MGIKEVTTIDSERLAHCELQIPHCKNYTT